MALDSIAKLGRVEKEFEIVPELKIRLHTLNAVEQQEALASVPETVNGEIARFSALQRALLTQATDSVNGEIHGKDELIKFYGEMQNTIFQEVFNSYLSLADEQTQTIEDLKKK